MVHNEVYIPLCQKFKTGPLWKYHAQEGVCIFHTAFLTTSHRVTEIDAGSLNTCSSDFERLRIPEFTPSVGQDIFKDHVECISSKPTFQTVKDKADGAFCTPVYQKCEKQLLISEKERQQGFLRFTAGMNGIHFSKRGKIQLLKVCKRPVRKDRAVCYLGFVTFARAEHGFALQVNVPGGKKSPVKIVIDGADRQIQFRMAHHDLIRGLPIFNQRGYDHIHSVQFLSAQRDTAAGISKLLTVPPVSSFGIVCIFSCNGTVIDCFRTAIADIGGFIQSAAAFHLVIFTGLVAGRTGSAFDAADNDFAAYICFGAVIAVDAEVSGIVKGAFMVPV